MKDAPIIVLDEATAYADPENEQQIQQAFEGLTKGKTVIMIAHRLSTVQNADQILVMRQGELVESGRHNELVKKMVNMPVCGRTIPRQHSGILEMR